MKSKLLIALLVAGFVFVSTPRAEAALTDTIAVAITLASDVSVTLDQTDWNLENIALESVSAGFTVKAQVGNVATKLVVKSSAPAGGWTLAAAAASDTCVITNDIPELTLTDSDQTLAASVVPFGATTNIFKFHAPTADTKGGGVSQGVTITYTASAP